MHSDPDQSSKRTQHSIGIEGTNDVLLGKAWSNPLEPQKSWMLDAMVEDEGSWSYPA